MKIQEMIEAIKNGKKVRRKYWSGNKFLYYVPSASYPAMTDIAKSIADKNGEVNGNNMVEIQYCHELQHFLFGLGLKQKMEV